MAARDTHALEVLEFPRVLRRIAARATSGPGRAAVRALRPLAAAPAVAEALDAVEQMVGYVRAGGRWPPGRIPDLMPAVRELRVEGSVLGREALIDAGMLLAASAEAKRRLPGEDEGAARLSVLAGRLLALPEMVQRLGRTFDPSGELTDAASPELRRIRRALRARRRRLVESLESVVRELPARIRVRDASITLRNGRYCIPIRREGRSALRGIVHDESASHHTLFVEPPVAIEPMNQIRELEMAEDGEARRILRRLTEELRPRVDELESTLAALSELDSLYARAVYAMEHGCERPEVVPPDADGEIRIVGGRHPLLLESGDTAVPFQLALRPEERILLVSGPNAGGKTVLLKAVGLLCAMGQSGIVPPVEEGTRWPMFTSLFAVIGDEQSIDASLSTFSAHIRNLGAILEHATGSALVLVDEIGSNTDPSEGAALAAAALLRLAGQVRLAVATTHLGALKALAAEDGRTVNASLQFDAERLRPTFRLVRDRPGRSYALEIAGRLGFPDALLAEARARLSPKERALEGMLAELERREAELAKLTAGVRREATRLERRAVELEERLAEVERRAEDLAAREIRLERSARRREERYLLEARDRVEAVIRDLENRYAAAGGGEPARRRAARAARAAVEAAVRRGRALTPDPREERASVSPEDLPREGDIVWVQTLARTGRVLEIRGGSAVVTADGIRLTVPITELSAARAPVSESDGPREEGKSARPRDTAAAPVGRRPAFEPSSEVDVRGLRGEEMEPVLIRAIDAAVQADLPFLRVIHGKGTGVLRRRVREILRADDRTRSFRLGEFGEGGSGVTVIEWKRGSSKAAEPADRPGSGVRTDGGGVR
ncbi:MAG: endonuclease MutS2 [Gemmatimonadota bacterium]